MSGIIKNLNIIRFNKMSENLPFDIFIPDIKARELLSQKLNISYSIESEDWEWEVSDQCSLQELKRIYIMPDTNYGEKASILEIYLDRIEHDEDSSELSSDVWEFVESAISTNLKTHKGTLVYWIENQFKIRTKLMEIVKHHKLKNQILWNRLK